MEKPYPKTVLALAGPTAVGKTGVAIALAQHFKTEIVSFDSRQFYRELKIGAAPPSTQELAKAPHHFIGHLSVDEEWSAGQFEKAALKKVEALFKNHNLIILVGGSGLYLRAFCQGLDEMPTVEPHHRTALNAVLETQGLPALQEELAQKDPDFYEKVDLQNPQRIIRALELIRGSGKTYTELRQQSHRQRPFNILKVGLNLPRPQLYARINERVDLMVAQGLVQEAQDLLPYQEKNALQTVGYKELFKYFGGLLSLEEAIVEIKKNSRRYAKRQITWFKKEPGLQWFNPTDVPELIKLLKPYA